MRDVVHRSDLRFARRLGKTLSRGVPIRKSPLRSRKDSLPQSDVQLQKKQFQVTAG